MFPLATLDLWGQLAHIFQAWRLYTNVRGIFLHVEMVER